MSKISSAIIELEEQGFIKWSNRYNHYYSVKDHESVPSTLSKLPNLQVSIILQPNFILNRLIKVSKDITMLFKNDKLALDLVCFKEIELALLKAELTITDSLNDYKNRVEDFNQETKKDESNINC